MATTRLLRSTKPVQHVPSSRATSSSSVVTIKCKGKAELGGGEKIVSVCRDGDNKRKPMVANAMKTSTGNLLTLEPTVVDPGVVDLASLLANISGVLVNMFSSAVKLKPRKLQVQMFIEKAIIDCRFFTLFAVVGSLIGSVLCFLEGCFLIVESYLDYFNTLSGSSDQGRLIQHLIEGIDMFLMGTAMLIFGVGLHFMFVGPKNSREKGLWLPGSNLFGLFHLKSIPAWVQMQSVSQAKSKLGHAVLMILQVGVLEKFKNIPLVTSLDLACFAGAVMVSSACIFLLSKLSTGDINYGR